ncbi:MAG TPA: hypothetical protein VJO33_20045 [Gemmatimonadaceae bacterium]|nr:hypothetical protein [Gemmatimonadaceae bacterium]
MIQNVVDAVQRILRERRSPMLVAIDGRSGAGKSTLAEALAIATSGIIIPSDDFFAAEITSAEWDTRNSEERARDAIDWRRLRAEALEPLLAGRDASWFPFDFAAGPMPNGAYRIATELTRRTPAPVLILDGAYSTRPELADLVDLTVLIETAASVRLRRLADRESPELLASWHARWDAAEDYYFAHVRPQSAFDLIVDYSSAAHQ